MKELETLDFLTGLIVAAKKDITCDNQLWWETAKAIADSCGESGRADFLAISQFYPDFSREENDQFFTRVLNKSRGGHSLGTLVKLMRDAGIQIPEKEKKKLNLTSYTNSSSSHTRERAYGGGDNGGEMADNGGDDYNLAEGLPSFRLDGWTQSISRALEFTDTKEKGNAMVLAYSAMVGGLINKRTSFVYSGQRWSPCQQIDLIGESATGKDVVNCASQLFKTLQEDAYAEYAKTKEKYEVDKALWNSAGKKKSTMPMPRLPKKTMPLLSANISGSDLIRTIIDNGGVGTIVSVEADSWTKSVRQKDWGVGSDTERRLYEHDRLTISRATDGEYAECPETYVTIVLSGTPGQLRPRIPSAENGQFSRKLFYVLPSVESYKSQFGNKTYKPVFAKWGVRWNYLFTEIFKNVGHIMFSLSEEQISEFDKHWAAQFNKMKALGEKDLRASVLRMGINALRQMNLIALMRSLDDMFIAEDEPEVTIEKLLQCPGLKIAATTCEDNRKDGIITALDLSISDDDFHLALDVADVLLAHATRVARLLPKSEVGYRKPTQSEMFWESLPGQFTRKEAKAKAKEFGLTEDAMDVAIKRKVDDGTLKKSGRGSYLFARACETRKGKRKM